MCQFSRKQCFSRDTQDLFSIVRNFMLGGEKFQQKSKGWIISATGEGGGGHLRWLPIKLKKLTHCKGLKTFGLRILLFCIFGRGGRAVRKWILFVYLCFFLLLNHNKNKYLNEDLKKRILQYEQKGSCLFHWFDISCSFEYVYLKVCVLGPIIQSSKVENVKILRREGTLLSGVRGKKWIGMLFVDYLSFWVFPLFRVENM